MPSCFRAQKRSTARTSTLGARPGHPLLGWWEPQSPNQNLRARASGLDPLTQGRLLLPLAKAAWSQQHRHCDPGLPVQLEAGGKLGGGYRVAELYTGCLAGCRKGARERRSRCSTGVAIHPARRSDAGSALVAAARAFRVDAMGVPDHGEEAPGVVAQCIDEGRALKTVAF